MLLRFFCAALFFSQLLFANAIDSLLNELAYKDDLSLQTRKKTTGFVSSFTRKDLDRMKIRSLDEIIEKIPFIKTKIDNKGFSDPFYAPYQYANPSRIRLFINDREIATSLFGSGFKLFAQIDMSYIDHVQVYYVLPSYEISFEASAIIIKAYTKVGKRENATVIGSSIGTRGTNDTYAYKSESLDDFSYIAYINHRDLKREKEYNLARELSKDKKTTNMFAQISHDTSSFELQVVDGDFDQFAGHSWEMTPIYAKGDFTYLSTSFSSLFQDESLKLFLHYIYMDTNTYESATSPLGVVPTINTPYFTSKLKLKEHIVDFKITKNYYINDTSILIGANNKLKKFSLNQYYADGIKLPKNSSFDRENISSVFIQIEHDLNAKHKAIVSSTLQNSFYNANIDSRTIGGARLGHIYNGSSIVQKTFFMYGEFTPSSQIVLYHDMGLLGTSKLKNEVAYSLTTESLWSHNNIDLSFMLGRILYNNSLYIDSFGHIKNANEQLVLDNVHLHGTCNLSDNDKIDFSIWAAFTDLGKNNPQRHRKDYGATLSLYKKLLFLDTYNSITYVNSGQGVSDGLDYSATLSYEYSKDLEFFIKARNIFDTAHKSDFISINPITDQITKLNDISNIDRSFWFGLEYQF